MKQKEANYSFDQKDHMKKGHSFKDYITPDSYEHRSDYFRIGDRYSG